MKNRYLVALILLIHLGLLVYLKFTAWPEMTLWPYLMTKGWMPYRDIAIAHTPLMLIDLSVFTAVFGVGIWQLKVFTWILILGMDGAVFFVARKLWNYKAAVFSLVTFALFQVFFDGNGLWFDLYMGFFAFVSFYFVRQKKYLWAGVFWALAFISKQTAIWFLVPIWLEVAGNEKLKAKSSLNLVYGSSLVLTVFILLLAVFNLLPDFFHWAVNFGIFILPKAQGQVQLPGFKNLAVSLFPFIVFIPLILRTKAKYMNLFFWAVAGSLGAYPRFEFFHFQPALPYLAIASALVFTEFAKKDILVKYFVFLYVFGSVYLFAIFFMRNYKEGVRFYEKDVQDIVSYVKSNTSPGDRIFVMNWWDNIYALSDRLPATDPWVPQLSWYMEIPDIQEGMINDLQEVKPKIIILSQYSEVGLSAYIPQKVYNYVMQNYKIKEKVDGINILVSNK